jgi:hypothetical protein
VLSARLPKDLVLDGELIAWDPTAGRLDFAALQAHATEAVENLQHLEGARLDALQRALWAKAMEGDLPAGTAIVRIVQAPCRLYGLTGNTRNPGLPTPRTVVMSQGELS